MVMLVLRMPLIGMSGPDLRLGIEPILHIVAVLSLMLGVNLVRGRGDRLMHLSTAGSRGGRVVVVLALELGGVGHVGDPRPGGRQ